MGADVLTAGEGAGCGMARITEARGDRLPPLNLVGGASHLEGWHWGAAGMQFHQPGEREHADAGHSGGQQRRQARTAPFEHAIGLPPGAAARPAQQRDSGEQQHEADDIQHTTSSGYGDAERCETDVLCSGSCEILGSSTPLKDFSI